MIEPCKDGRACINCDLSDVCGGVAKEKKEGFLKRDAAIDIRHRLIHDEFFFVQMMLKQPRPLDAIIPEFHDGSPYVKYCKYNPSLPTYRTFDWGTRGNFVCLWIQVDEAHDRLFVIDEYHGGRGAFPSREAKIVLSFEQKRGYKNIHGSYGDPRGPTWIREFELYGIYVIPLVRKKADRVALLGRLLQIRKEDSRPSLIISPKCKSLRAQLLTYDARCLFDQKGHPPDDAVDSLLYGLNGLRGKIQLRDDAAPGIIALSADKKREQRHQKYSQQFADYLELARGKTDFNRLLQ